MEADGNDELSGPDSDALVRHLLVVDLETRSKVLLDASSPHKAGSERLGGISSI